MNRETYPRETFYGDLTHLLRIRTARVDPAPGEPFRAPSLVSADQYFRVHLDTPRRQKLQKLVIQDVKLLGCRIYTELKRLQASCNKYLADEGGQSVHWWAQRLGRRVESIHREIRRYRTDYVWKVKNDPLLLDEEVRRAFLLIDEYVSYRLESVLVHLHTRLTPPREGLDDLLNQVEALLWGAVGLPARELPGRGRF